MKTLLIAVILNGAGQYVPVTYEMTPLGCASLMQAVSGGHDHRIIGADGEESPRLEMAACIEVRG